MQRYETLYATVYYRSENDFYAFAKNIGSLGIFGRSVENATARTSARVDAVVNRVEDILDMHPPGLHVAVYIYPTKKEIEETYRGMGIYSDAPIAFYSHRRKAIFISAGDVTGGVFAHEFAHAVLSLYFVTPPPAKMQEILAQFVDKHLGGE